MILKTLQIQNFRKYKQASIEFPEGIIGVVGLNGSGKSTIFEAIAWALYGTVAARTSSEDIRRDTAEPSSVCLVDLQFQFEGDEYRIVRHMKGKNLVSSATVTRNGKIAATGSGPATTYIQKILGIDYKSFFTSIFAKQKELNTLSSMNASERKPLILKMLGIDALDDVIKQINAEKRTKKTLVTHLEKNISDSQGRDKHDLLLTKEHKYKQQIQDIKKDISRMKKELTQLKQNHKTQKEKINDAKKTYESTNKQYEKLIKQKTQFEHHKQITHEIEELQKKIEKRIETIQALTTKIDQYKDLQNELRSIQQRIQNITKTSSNLLQQQTKQQTSLALLQKEKKDLISKQQSIQKLGSDASCPTCERQLGEQYEFLLDKYGKKETKNATEQIAITETIKNLQTKTEQLNRELTALNKKKEYYETKQNEQQTLTVKRESQQQEKTIQQKEMEKKQLSLKKISSVDFDLSSFKSIQIQRKQQYTAYQQLIKTANTARDSLTKKQILIEKTQSQLSLIQQKLTTTKKQQQDLKTMKDTVNKQYQQIQEISLLKDVMSDFRLYLISRIRPALSYHASRFYHDLTDGKYPEILLDEHYNISIYDNGEEYPIERFSGGEVDLANLCLRLAISDVITERAEGLFHFIILDEIFGSQDHLRQQNIMQELYMLSSTFKQIFLITHVEQVKHYMQHIISVEEIDNESKIMVQ